MSWKGRYSTLFKCILVTAIVGVIFCAGYSETYMWFHTEKMVENTFDLPYYQVAIEEAYEPPEHWNPGESVLKQVAFANRGDLNALVRVSYLEFWQSYEEGVLLSNVFMTANGTEQPTAEKNWTTAWLSEWQDGGDGYYYYKKVLEAAAVTAPVLQSITLHTDAPGIYGNALYELSFQMESLIWDAPPEEVWELWMKKPLIDNQGNVQWTD